MHRKKNWKETNPSVYSSYLWEAELWLIFLTILLTRGSLICFALVPTNYIVHPTELVFRLSHLRRFP